ncbi:MAG: hypothetical protein SGILL_003572 [Bacillariaceae sp.]
MRLTFFSALALATIVAGQSDTTSNNSNATMEDVLAVLDATESSNTTVADSVAGAAPDMNATVADDPLTALPPSNASNNTNFDASGADVIDTSNNQTSSSNVTGNATASPSPVPSASPTRSPSDAPSIYPTIASNANYYDKPKLKWTTKLDSTGVMFSDTKLATGNTVQSSPDGVLVYVTMDNGSLVTLAAHDGSQRWVYTPEPISSGWTVMCDSGVYFGTMRNGEQYAVYAIVDVPPSGELEDFSS